MERLQKVIASTGYCSRRKAEELIKEGKVMVDDRGSTWAKPGTAKHYVNADLTYSKEKNPNATSHWEVPAQENYKSQVAQEIEDYIKRM